MMEDDEEHADRMKRARYDDEDDEDDEMIVAAEAAGAGAGAGAGAPAVPSSSTPDENDIIKRELMDAIVHLDERGKHSCRPTWKGRRVLLVPRKRSDERDSKMERGELRSVGEATRTAEAFVDAYHRHEDKGRVSIVGMIEEALDCSAASRPMPHVGFQTLAVAADSSARNCFSLAASSASATVAAAYTKAVNAKPSSSSNNAATTKGSAGGKTGSGATTDAPVVPGDASAALYLPVAITVKPTVKRGSYNKNLIDESNVVNTTKNRCILHIHENLMFNLRTAYITHQLVTTQSQFKANEHNDWNAVAQQMCRDYGIGYGSS